MGTRKRIKNKSHKHKKRGKNTTKKRKKYFRIKRDVKNPFHISGRNIKKNTSKMSYDLFGKREIVDIYNYRAVEALDNMNKISDLKKSHYMYKPLLKEYRRRLQLLLKKNKNKNIYNRVLGKPYTSNGMKRLSNKNLEKVYYSIIKRNK